jgi:hypothetical protein
VTRAQITSWTNQSETITSVLASDPKRAPGDVAGDLFKKSTAKSLLEKVGVHKHTLIAQPTQDDLDWAAGCGNFRARPSDLFLKLYANVLLTLESDPLVGVVSPPLLASTGTIPLSILSVIPDQMRHYANMIVRTEHECCIVRLQFALHAPADPPAGYQLLGEEQYRQAHCQRVA